MGVGVGPFGVEGVKGSLLLRLDFGGRSVQEGTLTATFGGGWDGGGTKVLSSQR